jgi:hypothetical protein
MSIGNINRNTSNMNITNSSSVENIISTTYEEHEYNGHYVSFPGHQAPKVVVISKSVHKELVDYDAVDENTIYLIEE